MIEPLEEMPEGTVGFRATGVVTREEFRQGVLPPVRALADAGEVRMVFVVGPGFERLELGALAEDTKAEITLGLGHHDAWKRLALVTDVDWIANIWRTFAWLGAGEVKVYELDGLTEAETWVAE